MKKYNLLLVIASALFFNSCSSDSSGRGAGSAGGINTNDFNEGYTQIERLGRPAINEGLVISNDFLNAFNSIQPSSDFSDAAAPVRAEAVAVLTVVTGLIGGGPDAATVAGQFLPDVMRIDTSAATPGVGASTVDANVGYISCTSGTGPLLCGGRKLQDDVIDITLSYIAGGNPTQPYAVTDNVAYATDHTSTVSNPFPYLAQPK